MSISVQPRGGRFQLRVRHRLLPKPFIFTFAAEAEAREYGRKLVATLDTGHVPIELQAQVGADDPLLIEVIRAYTKGAPHLTDSDDKLLGAMLPELAGVRLSAVTYAWAERYVRDLKVRAKLAPGSIRKRCGALARVIDWRLRSTNSKAANALRLLPTGYSHYTANDRAGLGGGPAPTDVHRDRRLAPGEEAKVRTTIAHIDTDRLRFTADYICIRRCRQKTK